MRNWVFGYLRHETMHLLNCDFGAITCYLGQLRFLWLHIHETIKTQIIKITLIRCICMYTQLHSLNDSNAIGELSTSGKKKHWS